MTFNARHIACIFTLTLSSVFGIPHKFRDARLHEAQKKAASCLSLSLIKCGLNGPFPHEICTFTELTKLDLSENDLTGPLPFHLSNLKKLKKVYLGSNQLTGELPGQALGQQTDLCYVDASDNDFHIFDARFFKSHSDQVRIIEVDLTGNPLVQFWGPISENVQLFFDPSRPITFYAPVFKSEKDLKRLSDITYNSYIHSTTEDPICIQFIGKITPFLARKGIINDTLIELDQVMR